MIRVRNLGREAMLASLFGLLAVVAVAYLLLHDGDGPKPAAVVASVTGDVIRRDVVLSSGGYNAFAGAWLDPRNGHVGTAFVNVTGGAAPPCRRPEVPAGCADRGFRGAAHRYVVVESENDGRRWQRAFADEPLPSAAPHAFAGQATTALKDGTLLRRVNGEDLAVFPETSGGPATAYLQRRAPGAPAWTGRQVLLEPARFTYNLARIERLRDGRTLVAIGAFWPVAAGQRTRNGGVPGQWLLLTSTDEGASWHNAMAVPPAAVAAAPANEWDVAELPGGDLLAVMRTREGATQVRKQVVLERTDDTINTNTGTQSDGGWVMGTPSLTPAGFAQDPTPQHPELLSVQYGPAAGGIVHIADQSIHYSPDGGRSWSRVSLPSDWTPHYYPVSVQGRGGNIYVFSHGGSDEAYTSGAVKPVYADVIRLVPDVEATP